MPAIYTPFTLANIMGSFNDMQTQQANYANQAGNSRAAGIAAKQSKYQQAYSMEADSARNAYLVSDNMMTLRQNQTAATGSARAANAASGFMASSGSKLTTEQSVAQVFESQIANMNKSNVIADSNAREAANMSRRDGDTALHMSNIQADFYDASADALNSSKWWALGGDSLQFLAKTSADYNLVGPGGAWWNTTEKKK